MCYIIVVGMPRSAQANWLNRLPDGTRGFAAYEELSPVMGNVATFAIVKGICSCDLFHPGSYEATIKKYRRKGWSEARIQRTLADIAKNRNPFGLDRELRLWLANVADNVGTAYLFIHWISNKGDTGKRASFSAEQIRDDRVDVPEEQIIQIGSQGKSAPSS